MWTVTRAFVGVIDGEERAFRVGDQVPDADAKTLGLSDKGLAVKKRTTDKE